MTARSRRGWRVLAPLLRISGAVLAVLFVSIMFFEHRWIYYPDTEVADRPDPPFEELAFDASDGTRIHGWLLPAGGGGALLVSHGNAGNIGHRAGMAEFLRRELGLDVLVYDYRGYGQSEGAPSEEGTYSDIRGAYRLLRSRGYPPERIFLLGQSLGSAVSVELAASERIGGLVLEAPFTSIGAMARHLFRLPLDLLVRTRYDSLSRIGRVQAPVAVVHARNDPVVPFSMGRELFEAVGARRRLFALDGEIHEGALMAMGLERLGELRDFLGLEPPAAP